MEKIVDSEIKFFCDCKLVNIVFIVVILVLTIYPSDFKQSKETKK